MESIKEKNVKEIFTVDLMEMINLLLSKMGKFQILLLILLSVNSGIVAISHTLTSFNSFEPKFYCRNNNQTTCETGEQDHCDGYEFIGDTHTIVSEWSLICSRRLLAPLVSTLYFAGVTIGALICGSIADIWGRRIIVFICLYIQCILGLLLYFSNSLEMFIVLRTIQGFFVQGLQGVTYTLMLEYCAPKFRTGAGVVWEIFWAFGLFYLGGMSYIIPDWRYLQLALAIPSILTLTYIWIIPESLCWLVATKQYTKGYNLSLTIAKRNGNNEYINEYKNLPINLNNDKNEDIDKNNTKNRTSSILDVFRNIILRKHSSIMCCVWFSVTLSYYGILYYLPKLAGERHFNFLLGAVIELIAYVIAYFILSKFGRRIPMVTYQYINGFICILIGLLTIFFMNENDEETKSWIDPFIIFLTLIAKGLAVSSFCGMFIYTTELFPTVCRSAALGLCGFFSRVGSLLAPQLMILFEYTHQSLPMIVMGLAIIITGTSTIFLPETLGTSLPNTITESDKRWKKT